MAMVSPSRIMPTACAADITLFSLPAAIVPLLLAPLFFRDARQVIHPENLASVLQIGHPLLAVFVFGPRRFVPQTLVQCPLPDQDRRRKTDRRLKNFDQVKTPRVASDLL